MKRIFLAALAVTMIAAPIAAEAQSRYVPQREYQDNSRKSGNQRHIERKDTKRFEQKRDVRRHETRRDHWKRGGQVPSWQRKNVVRDYHRHGLRKPGRGQQWVKVDNQYLLIGLASGIIAGLAASR